MSGLQIAGVVLMVVGLAGMIFCSKKQKTNPAMQPVALVLFVVVVAGACMMLSNMFGDSNQSIIDNELRFSNSRGFVAAQQLAKNYKGKKVLFITYPNAEKNEAGMGVVNAFKEGFEGGEVVTASPAVPANFEESGMTIEETMKAKDFDDLLAKNSDAAVVVSAIGLPENAPKMKFFSMAPAKRPAMFLISTGSFFGKKLVEYVKNGAIAGVIIPNPSAKYDVKAPGNLAEAFAIRYVLVDKSNLDKFQGNLQQ